ncbi:hypothetical protein C8R43DRAFT_941168 [Mycena crocata]|nr:hypothetical protein C8R43DRAFT_941168 [Mycena crocata]
MKDLSASGWAVEMTNNSFLSVICSALYADPAIHCASADGNVDYPGPSSTTHLGSKRQSAGTCSSLFYGIPTEILREITTSVDAATDTAALCRVSPIFNVVTAPVLYRHLYLNTVEKVLGSFDTLAKDPKHQRYVRSVDIEIYRCNRSSAPFKLCDREFFPSDMIFPLEDVLRTLPYLTHLSLRIPDFDTHFLMIFATLALPDLRTFSIPHPGTYSPILSSFLNCHQHITHLDLIRPYMARAAPNRGIIPLLHLLHLRVYRGCSVYAASLVVAQRSLLHVELWDAPTKTDIELLFSVLGEATAPHCAFELTILWDGPSKVVGFTALSRFIPHTRAFSIGPFVKPVGWLKKKRSKHIAEALEMLVDLTHLEFYNVEPEDKGHNSLGLDPVDTAAICAEVNRDFKALKLWNCREWTRSTGIWKLKNQRLQ